MRPIMLSLLNPLPLISSPPPCASADVGVLSWNQFPRKAVKWKALFQPLRQIRLRPCVEGSCLFVSTFPFVEKVKWAGRGASRAAFCHTLFMAVPPRTGSAKTWSVQFACEHKAVAPSANGRQWTPMDTNGHLWTGRTTVVVRAQKVDERLQKKLSEMLNLNTNPILANGQLGPTDADWVCFSPLQLAECWNKSVSSSELMWNTWWAVTAWMMTALFSYELQSYFDNSHGVLLGQIFVKRGKEAECQTVRCLREVARKRVYFTVWKPVFSGFRKNRK